MWYILPGSCATTEISKIEKKRNGNPLRQKKTNKVRKKYLEKNIILEKTTLEREIIVAFTSAG